MPRSTKQTHTQSTDTRLPGEAGVEDTLECGEAKAGPHTEGQARPLQCRGPESTSGTSHDGKEGEKAVCVCVCVCVRARITELLCTAEINTL